MKRFLRSFIITGGALWATSQVLPSFMVTGGPRGFVIGVLAFMLANILLVPLIKILLLPLNLLTLGLFAWLSNVLALYVIATYIPSFQVLPYFFPGANLGGFIVPPYELTPFLVVITASFLIGLIVHIAQWLMK